MFSVPSDWTSRFSFREFVVGPCNEAAYAAASAAVVAPGTLHNPILITGPTGSGKTHLAQAVAIETRLRGRRSVLLLSADEFLRRLSHATRNGGVPDTVRTLLEAGTVIVDDAHLIDRRAMARQALASLASAASECRAQLLLTSDTAAGAETRAGRLAHFRSAQIATLGTPDWSHRVAILHAKARGQGVQLPPAVAHHVASQCRGSTRELEGLLTRLLATATLDKAPLSLSLAMRVIPPRARAGMDIVGAQVVQEAVAAEWGVPADALAGSGRTRRVSQPRRLAMLLCRDVLALSLREIGAAFGARDVSTVFSAITRARDDVRRDVAVFDRVQRVRSELPMKSATATSLR